ncbi:MAG: amidase [Pseudomonadota bacterium]
MPERISPELLAERSAWAIGAAMASGRADPVALTGHLLERIAAQTSPVFLAVTGDRALREAKAAWDRLAAGRPLSALDGVPIAWKDLIDMAGETTTAGSETLRNAPPKARDATVVSRAAMAGMISLGKLNLTEFAYSGIGLNPHFGTPVNPNTATACAPGGSSSGSGVAVAAGLAPVAAGTDTGGSVRVPAAFNGVVGYKSSEGRIEKQGVFDLSPTLDTVGPLARSVLDCVLVDAVFRGVPVPSVRRRPVAGMSIIVPETLVFDDLDPAVAENFEASISRLAQAGAAVTRRPLPAFAKAFDQMGALGTITAAEAYVTHRALMDGPDRARIDRRVAARIEPGSRMSAADILTVQQTRLVAIETLRAELGGAFLAYPTAPHTAPEIAPLEADDSVFHAMNLKSLRNTMMGNYFDLPGLAIPNGRDARGLPTSFLLSASGGQDEALLGAGLGAESVIRGDGF